MVKCGQSVDCEEICGQPLNCQVHDCQAKCHEGKCKPCEVKYTIGKGEILGVIKQDLRQGKIWLVEKLDLKYYEKLFK